MSREVQLLKLLYDRFNARDPRSKGFSRRLLVKWPGYNSCARRLRELQMKALHQRPTVAVLALLRGKIARQSRKILGRNAASALESQSVASNPGWPARVLGKNTCVARLNVNVIAHG